jgi:hypothetical protein
MLRTMCFAVVVMLLARPLAGSRDADARMMIVRPNVARSCPGSATWQATQRCLERFGAAKLLRSQGNLRLVQLKAREPDFRTSGLYLYVQTKQQWHLGGIYQDARPSIIGISTPTYEHRKLVRIDVVYAANEELLIDEVTLRNAFVRRKTAVFCSGDSSSCTQILTACDVFVGGKLHATFRGTLAYEGGGKMTVDGERSRAGDQCAQPEEAFIPVPTLE